MLIVMAYGYAKPTGQVVPAVTGPAGNSPDGMKAVQERVFAVEDDRTQALIPFIDKNH